MLSSLILSSHLGPYIEEQACKMSCVPENRIAICVSSTVSLFPLRSTYRSETITASDGKKNYFFFPYSFEC